MIMIIIIVIIIIVKIIILIVRINFQAYYIKISVEKVLVCKENFLHAS